MAGRLFATVVAAGLLALASAQVAGAATFTVTNANNSGPGSLRAAILAANATAAADTIRFAIPGAGGHTISLTSALPAIVHPAAINGQTQPGYNGVPLVQLDDAGGAGAIGIDISAGGSKVLGLSITGFETGVRLETGDGNTVAGDWIGIDLGGAAAGNGTGILVKGGSASNTIGGATPSLQNLVSGNQLGIELTGSGVTGNVLVDNCVGLGGACTDAVPNAHAGITIVGGASGNRIGGTAPGTRNAISGNGGDGLDITGAGTANNVVIGNYFGPDGADDEVFGNGGAGVRITAGASRNTIGGPSMAERNRFVEDSGDVALGIDASNLNLVRGNTITGGSPTLELSGGSTGNTIGGSGTGAGNFVGNTLTAAVELTGAGTKKNVVAGNDIGDASPLVSGLIGVLITAGASQNTIGGTTVGTINDIVGADADGVRIEGAGTTGNVVEGNQIGADRMGSPAGNAGAGVAIASGAANNTVGGNAGSGNEIDYNHTGVMLGGPGANNVVAGNSISSNGADGVDVQGGANHDTIGGTTAAARNVISDNGAAGVLLASSGTTANVVEGNYIGVGASGDTDFPNSEGVVLEFGAKGNTIGGTTAGARNVISGNGEAGVLVDATSSNVVEGNYIGTDSTGTKPVANGTGVGIVGGAAGNTIGGPAAGARNVISGNGVGVVVEESGTNGNSVVGNYVGVDASGSNALGNLNFGIGVASNTTTIRGNVASGNGSFGIALDTSTGCVVEGNLVGTDAAGTAAIPNGSEGIELLEGAASNRVGGTTAAARNIVSGNAANGIVLDGAGSKNVVEGNYVGLSAAGSVLGNAFDGISLANASNGNTIGGTTAAARNVVSGNGDAGIGLTDVQSVLVEGNYIGTNVAGTAAVPNGSAGVTFNGNATKNTIGGTTAGARNVISGNVSHGVLINGVGSEQNTIEGNYIGTNAAGKAAVPNGQDGVRVDEGGSNVIGGTVAGAGNVVSGNVDDGVSLHADGTLVEGNLIGTNAAGTGPLANTWGVRVTAAVQSRIGGTTAGARNVISGNGEAGIVVEGASTNFTLIEGNSIGLDVDGAAKLGNDTGILVTSGATNTTIGGTAAGAQNVISGNAVDGVAVSGDGTVGTHVEGNLIGTDAGGTVNRANGGNGVSFSGGADGNAVGGTAAGDGNTIAFNGGAGVVVDDTSSATNGDTVERNSIFSNAGLGIRLVGNGNDAIPSPNVDSVVTASTQTKITVSLGANVAVFRVEVFVSPSCDPSGAGEGRTFLAGKTVDANTTSTAVFSVPALGTGQAVTATETDLNNGSTSEFSTCFATP